LTTWTWSLRATPASSSTAARGGWPPTAPRTGRTGWLSWRTPTSSCGSTRTPPTLDSGYSAGAVSLAVSHTGPRWITTAEDAASFPFDIEVDPGWRITVTGITGAGTSQTFAVAPIPAALTAGAALRVADPAVLAM
jgi:hypothetical protein